MNWTLEIAFHFPHDRFAIGWEYIGPTEEEPIYTFKLYLLITTLTLDLFY
jgi:hypothetical protein